MYYHTILTMVSSEFAKRFGNRVQIVSDTNKTTIASNIQQQTNKLNNKVSSNVDSLTQLEQQYTAPQPTYNTNTYSNYNTVTPYQPPVNTQYNYNNNYNANSIVDNNNYSNQINNNNNTINDARSVVHQLSTLPIETNNNVKPTTNKLRSLLGDVNTATLPSFIQQTQSQIQPQQQTQPVLPQQQPQSALLPPSVQPQQPYLQQQAPPQYNYANNQPLYQPQYQYQPAQPVYQFQQAPQQQQYYQPMQHPQYYQHPPPHQQSHHQPYQQPHYTQPQSQRQQSARSQQSQQPISTYAQVPPQSTTLRHSAGARSVMSQPVQSTQQTNSYSQLPVQQLNSMINEQTQAPSRNLQSSNSYVSIASKHNKSQLPYKPYKLSDYHALPKQHKLGSLGPNIDEDKLNKLKQLKQYELQIRQQNTIKLSQMKPRQVSAPPKQLTVRDKIKQYVAHIPKPKIKQYNIQNSELLGTDENVNDDNNNIQYSTIDDQLQSTHIQYESVDDNIVNESIDRPNSPLSKLLRQHSLDRRQVAAEIQRLQYG